jgi:formylglycine-generating enzyme required for sulfatase activity
MARIFISYRRDDTGGYSLLLFDRLARFFGRDHVFMDIDTIGPGTDFVAAIENAVGACNVLIALIGKQWLNIADERGRRRIDVPEDYVRLEIAAALAREVWVIPVLVRGAPMPSVDDLPDPLKPLARRNAIALSDERMDYDLKRLLMSLVSALRQGPSDSWLDRLAVDPPRNAAGEASRITPAPIPAYRPTRLLFEPEMVKIPAGKFLSGDQNMALTLPDYWIGKYPIKVSEYRSFVQNGGYKERRYWTHAGWAWKEARGRSEPDYWTDELWTKNEWLPVVGVSWYEAYAYACWLSEKTGSPYHLPSSLEWEKAARGVEGCVYPWGNHKRMDACNCYAAGIGHTSRVGQFSPAGDSPFGIADMIGNVAEWSLTQWGGADRLVQNDEPEGSVPRVQHGGGWASVNLVRPATRARANPDATCNYVGFRVARSGGE